MKAEFGPVLDETTRKIQKEKREKTFMSSAFN